jgi:hypothetical protein
VTDWAAFFGRLGLGTRGALGYHRGMRSALAVLFAVLLAAPAFARGSHTVRGHTTKRGTYVAPSHATNPNQTRVDNYSTQGNVNPYTGAPGTKSP